MAPSPSTNTLQRLFDHSGSTNTLDLTADRQSKYRMLRKGKITKDLEIPIEAWRYVLITFALGLAGFMVGLDQSIIEPALPTIVAQFRSVSDIGAYTSAYLIPQCVLQPLCNKIYSLFAFSTVYFLSALTFCAGCLISATSQSSSVFIVGRAVAGIGAVGLSIGGFRMLALMPESKGQNLSMGAFSLVLGSSIVVGPVIGGVLTQSIGWHWIFWINLPVLGLSLVCILAATLFEGPDLRGENYELPLLEKVASLDWLGTSLLILTLVPLILGIEFGASDGWRSPRSVSMFVVGVVSLGLLIFQQKTTSREVIFDPKVILNRSVWTTAGLFFSALSSTAVLVLFLPFLFQQERGVSPRTSGFLTFPLAGTLAIGTFIFSIVSTLVSYFNPLAVAGATLFLIANVLFIAMSTGSTSTSTIPQIIGFEVIAGSGLGMAWLSEIIFPRAELGKHQLATSLGYTRMMQQIGGAVSVQIAAAIFTDKLTREVEALPFPRDLLLALVQGAAPGGVVNNNQQLPADAKEAVALAYGKAIRAGLIPATVFAAMALVFSLMLPWTKLKGGVTERSHDSPLNAGREELADSAAAAAAAAAPVENKPSQIQEEKKSPTPEQGVDKSELTLVAQPEEEKAEPEAPVDEKKASQGKRESTATVRLEDGEKIGLVALEFL
ncbi:major facilitator superfamily domain-containing protein [Podospora didyma]|uniref:Major facilitator superfamily domain-containing protein n=1 Tax=Podospora didyma TaxID=330526 RepID=A0AAE0NBJ2_9PEZI|nr:major facilitator superfamily domain-containing protein [Podospora didyma]